MVRWADTRDGWFGVWMADIGRADTERAGLVDGMMRGKNKKAVRREKPHCKHDDSNE